MTLTDLRAARETKEPAMVAKLAPRVHPRCFVCSQCNTRGLQLRFNLSGDLDVEAAFKLGKEYEGYPGTIHGGILCSILDGAMCHAVLALGRTAVTADLNVQFRHPVRTNEGASVLAQVSEISDPVYVLNAHIVQSGQVTTIAGAKYIERPNLNGG